MSRVCQKCGKGYQKAITRVLLRGHLNPTKKKRQHPNLQTKKITTTETKNNKTVVKTQRMKLCTQCLKTLNKS